jgi:hypothetical protein
MKQQTAVSWLVKQLRINGVILVGSDYEIIEQAKEMEKQQIIETYNKGRSAGIHDYIDTEWGNDPTELTAGQYYEQTFKSE